MEEPLNITALNDFIFCPVSIYFHGLYGDMERVLYQSSDQLNGTKAHETIDNAKYTGSVSTLQSLEVYCEKYNLIGKIDLFEKKTNTLIERKKKVKTIYDGYVFQVYAQYFAMTEMGYAVNKILIRSIDDNKNYPIELPQNNSTMLQKFENTIDEINKFNFSDFIQSNSEKCLHCIYEPYCDRGVVLK